MTLTEKDQREVASLLEWAKDAHVWNTLDGSTCAKYSRDECIHVTCMIARKLSEITGIE